MRCSSRTEPPPGVHHGDIVDGRLIMLTREGQLLCNGFAGHEPPCDFGGSPRLSPQSEVRIQAWAAEEARWQAYDPRGRR